LNISHLYNGCKGIKTKDFFEGFVSSASNYFEGKKDDQKYILGLKKNMDIFQKKVCLSKNLLYFCTRLLREYSKVFETRYYRS